MSSEECVNIIIFNDSLVSSSGRWLLVSRLNFLMWTQGEIRPGKRASPVSWARMKRPSIANCSKVLDNVLSIKCGFSQNYTESLAIQDTGWQNCAWATVFCKNFRHLLKRLLCRAHSVIILSFNSHNICSWSENGYFSTKRCTKELSLPRFINCFHLP